MSAPSSVVSVNVAEVQKDVSVSVRGTVEGTGVQHVGTPLFEGAKKVIRP